MTSYFFVDYDGKWFEIVADSYEEAELILAQDGYCVGDCIIDGPYYG